MKNIIKYFLVALLITALFSQNANDVVAESHSYTYDDLTESMTFTSEDSLLLPINGYSQLWVTILINEGSSVGSLIYNDYLYTIDNENENEKYKLISKKVKTHESDRWIGYTISFYKYSTITIDPNGATVTSVPEGWTLNNGKYEKEFIYPDLLTDALAEWDGVLVYEDHRFVEWEHHYELEDDKIRRPMEIKARWLTENTAKVCIDPKDSKYIYVPHGFVKSDEDGKYYKEYSVGTNISDITKEVVDNSYADPAVADDDNNYYYYRFLHSYSEHEGETNLVGDGLVYYPEFSQRLEITMTTDNGDGTGEIYDDDGYTESEMFVARGATYTLNNNVLTIHNNNYKQDENYVMVADEGCEFAIINNLPNESFESEITLDIIFNKIKNKPSNLQYNIPKTGIH